MARFNPAAIRHHHTIPSIAATVMKLKRVGGEYIGCCPFHDDRRPSLTVYDQGRKFKCFGCGAQGDVIDFVQRLHNVGTREAAEMLGARALPRVTIAMPAAQPREDRREEVIAIARASVPATDTLGEVYLRSRGLVLPIPETVRYAELPYGRTGPPHPTLVTLITSTAGALVAIQRTYLNSAGTGKASVSKPKLSLGSVRGGAIRLAPCADQLIIAEGLEDALTLQQELGRPAWVSVGTSNLVSMELPASVTSVTIGADADAAGEQAARSAAERFASQGRQVRIIRPRAPFKDFNEQLQAASR